jgi:hypothetical protein
MLNCMVMHGLQVRTLVRRCKPASSECLCSTRDVCVTSQPALIVSNGCHRAKMARMARSCSCRRWCHCHCVVGEGRVDGVVACQVARATQSGAVRSIVHCRCARRWPARLGRHAAGEPCITISSFTWPRLAMQCTAMGHSRTVCWPRAVV